MNKAALRKEMKKIILQLSSEEIKHQSTEVTQKLLNLQAYKDAQRISIFLSMKDEIDTAEILQHALRAKKQCFIPHYFTDGSSTMKMVQLRDSADFNALPTTKWNIKQPADSDERPDALLTGGLDLILVPGLAFTRSGHRCGRGRGYYDKYLRKCKETQEKEPITVALAFKEQVLEHVPTDAHDFIINHVLHAGDA